MASSFLSQINANKSRFLLVLFILLGALTLTACGGGSASTNNSLGENPVDADNDPPIVQPPEEEVTGSGVQIGTGTGEAFIRGAIGSDITNVPAGGRVELRVNFVDLENEPFESVITVNFNSDCFANGIAQFSSEQIDTNAGGGGRTTYIANGCSGEDVVTATAMVDGEVLVARTTLTVEPDMVLGINYLGASETFLNLEGTGGNETTILTFRLVGALQGAIVGERVSFAIQGEEGGARIAEGQESNVTGTDGTVTTVLQSGTTATNIQVVARHDATGITASSGAIVISSGRPIQQSFSISQSSSNPFASENTDGVLVDVNILVSDQFGNDIAPGTQVNFFAECGVIEPSCEIDADSECSVLWRSNVSSQRANENRCSLLAFTEGVETFTDGNGNFVYESSDEFDLDEDDLPEPFVDENENGMFDPGERFVDTANGVNGSYDGPNGFWDGLCLQSSVPTANCDGEDSAVIFAQGLITTPCSEINIIPTPGPLPPNAIDLGSVDFIDLTTITSRPVYVTIEDACTPGNPPGGGIGLRFSAEEIEVSSFDVTTEDNLTAPETYRTSVSTDGTLSQDGELIFNVDYPDGDMVAFSWPAGDLCPTADVFTSSHPVGSTIDISGGNVELEISIAQECIRGEEPMVGTRVTFDALDFNLLDEDGMIQEIIRLEVTQDDLFRENPIYRVVLSSDAVASADGILTLRLQPVGGNRTEFTWNIID